MVNFSNNYYQAKLYLKQYVSEWSETHMEVSKRLAKKKRKLKIVILDNTK